VQPCRGALTAGIACGCERPRSRTQDSNRAGQPSGRPRQTAFPRPARTSPASRRVDFAEILVFGQSRPPPPERNPPPTAPRPPPGAPRPSRACARLNFSRLDGPPAQACRLRRPSSAFALRGHSGRRPSAAGPLARPKRRGVEAPARPARKRLPPRRWPQRPCKDTRGPVRGPVFPLWISNCKCFVGKRSRRRAIPAIIGTHQTRSSISKVQPLRFPGGGAIPKPASPGRPDRWRPLPFGRFPGVGSLASAAPLVFGAAP